MTGFKPPTSGVGSGRSTNCATTITAKAVNIVIGLVAISNAPMPVLMNLKELHNV